jgi:hypothetical protein
MGTGPAAGLALALQAVTVIIEAKRSKARVRNLGIFVSSGDVRNNLNWQIGVAGGEKVSWPARLKKGYCGLI